MSSLQDQLKNLGFSTADSDTPESTAAPAHPTSRQTQPIRIQRQTKGRKGKGVTVLFDLELETADIQTMASQLRKKCGVGGAVKDGTIELQGDQREAAKAWLLEQGYQVKFAGG
ncbi:stress response translation initiation inhibitor YciH [Pseudidiomarina aestuarii]|uniref:Stress response translation initiation inhibitor YciH n=1 Tax=Pseudidiomarina aestuarii TaxID=624146 RepID=A0A7Z7ET66_9GAMM|nr:stress response translation initiation inhibitor YciH [Pseudidiomarina aestuarii]RUO40746.1 stress response translation initiation inhibitor YciH [Pseudidiomarina aestuarii]